VNKPRQTKTKPAETKVPEPEYDVAPHKPKMKPGPCVRVPTHTNTKIYKTAGRVRYCICHDCGETWRQIEKVESNGKPG
jgi:hypothetical protein